MDADRLMAEYLETAPASAAGEAVEMLAGPPLLHCVHSRAGAQVAVRVLAQGTAKQRKKVIKAMKGVHFNAHTLNVIREVCCAGDHVHMREQSSN